MPSVAQSPSRIAGAGNLVLPSCPWLPPYFPSTRHRCHCSHAHGVRACEQPAGRHCVSARVSETVASQCRGSAPFPTRGDIISTRLSPRVADRRSLPTSFQVRSVSTRARLAARQEVAGQRSCMPRILATRCLVRILRESRRVTRILAKLTLNGVHKNLRIKDWRIEDWRTARHDVQHAHSTVTIPRLALLLQVHAGSVSFVVEPPLDPPAVTSHSTVEQSVIGVT